jgi:hypothetical protein
MVSFLMRGWVCLSRVLVFVKFIHIYTLRCTVCVSRGSSVSIVSDCGLGDRTIEVRSPVEAKDFPLASVSRPALGPTQPPVQWIPAVLSPGVKRGRDVTQTTHPHLVPRSRMSRSLSSPPNRLRGV